MPKSLSELREQLSEIEPEERTYAGIGPAEVDLLRELLNDQEEWLAARAVYALSRIDADNARDAIVSAAESPLMAVRAAVAATAGALPTPIADTVLSRLLNDPQVGVRKFAVKSTGDRNSDAVKRRIAEIAAADADSGLRRAAEQKARSLSRP